MEEEIKSKVEEVQNKKEMLELFTKTDFNTLVTIFKATENREVVPKFEKVEDWSSDFWLFNFINKLLNRNSKVFLGLEPDGKAEEIFEQKEREWQQRITELEKKFEPIVAENTEMSDVIADLQAEVEIKKKQITNLQAMNKDYIKSINEKEKIIHVVSEKLKEYYLKELDKWVLRKVTQDGDDYVLEFLSIINNPEKKLTEQSFQIPLSVYRELIKTFRGDNSAVVVKELDGIKYRFECNGKEYVLPVTFIQSANRKEEWFAKTLDYWKFDITVPKLKKKTKKNVKEGKENADVETIGEEEREENEKDSEDSEDENQEDAAEETPETEVGSGTTETDDRSSDVNENKGNIENQYFNLENLKIPIDDTDKKIIGSMVAEGWKDFNTEAAKLKEIVEAVRRRHPELNESIIQKRLQRHLLGNNIVQVVKDPNNYTHNKYFLRRLDED